MYKYIEKRLDVLYSYVFYKFCSDYKQLVPYKNFKQHRRKSSIPKDTYCLRVNLSLSALIKIYWDRIIYNVVACFVT